ncbi:23S rRNA (adenine(2503)-C(2))-methyltransferase RlmN [Candidatus Falkowbacteria bacterium]|nr:MAG: 23S rRNA (adenine(2503)-C(2))-methyltransferase RlmN [Candidatus Falkowbacteria bacterium]
MQTKNISEFIEKNKLPKYRFKQIIKAVYVDNVTDFSEITTIPKDLREKLSRQINILSFSVIQVLASKDKKSFKALLALSDGKKIETVLISPLSGQWSACLSSQTGCALGCKFCATGALGSGRNLNSEEICDQILFWRQYFKKFEIAGNFSNVVFMGMGEPFLNYDEIKKSIRQLLDPELFNFSARHISVSTAGIPVGIKNFAKDFPQLNLAISLNSALDRKRSELMPINKRFNLGKIKNALDFYLQKTKRKIFLEYIMLENINDSKEDADKLAEFIRKFERQDLLHVNLIRHNQTIPEFTPSSQDRVRQFKNYLLRNKISVSIRKSLGDEIKAACGQLAGK